MKYQSIRVSEYQGVKGYKKLKVWDKAMKRAVEVDKAKRDLAVDLAAMADSDNMERILTSINFVNYAVVALTQAIAASHASFEGLAAKRFGR